LSEKLWQITLKVDESRLSWLRIVFKQLFL